MKKLQKILGFIEMDGITHPFHFDASDFILKVYPPTIEKWMDDKFEFFDKFGLMDKTHKWVDFMRVSGVTSDNYNVSFLLYDNPETQGGFKEYQVANVVYYSKQYSLEKINGLRIVGGDINYYYPPGKALESTIRYNPEMVIKEMNVYSSMQEYETCGKYEPVKNVSAEIDVKAFSKLKRNNPNTPIEASSLLRVQFDSPVEISVVEETVFQIRSFMYYTSYRKNIHFDEIELCWLNDEGKKDYAGQMLIKYEYEKENGKNLEERIISYEFWGQKMSKMLTQIKNGKMVFYHICSGIADMCSYPPSRVMLVLTNFEREYRNIYGSNSRRSERYFESREEAREKLTELMNSKTNKRKKDFATFIKLINDADDSYEQRVLFALADCKDIMVPFLLKTYEGNYESISKGIASRMGNLRNGFMHSRLDLEFQAINLADVKVLEKLMYAIRLKTLEKNSETVRRSIGNLFG